METFYNMIVSTYFIKLCTNIGLVYFSNLIIYNNATNIFYKLWIKR